LDLFSGIGGFALAFEAAGFETAAFAEIEPYPCKVLAQHWPEVPNLGDVRGINGADYHGTVDVVVGGFPCQPHSVAGLQAGAADSRNLWPEMARIIDGCRPSWVLAENVPGLSDQFLDGISADLESLGYSVLAVEIPAGAAGAPQLRNRLWILARTTRPGLEGVHEAGRGEHLQPTETPVPGVFWKTTPRVFRRGDGIPHRVDRTRGLGNSIVPAVAYPFALWIASQLKAVAP
jgi:DNA (cytosine-5)-methyltransferase 1